MQPDPRADREPLPDTIEAAIARVLQALEGIGSLGEEIEDEWQYVQDLGAAWRERLEDVVNARGDEPLTPSLARAIARACDEAGLIGDPHRAIDWLSTLPQVVLAQLGERP